MKQFSYFSTLVFQLDLPEPEALNALLLRTIYADREADAEGVEKSNIRALGGWHSQTGLHKAPEFETMALHVQNAGKQVSKKLRYDNDYALEIGTMWSIINPPGAFNLAHVHPGCLWSGVYYVKVPKGSGDISFTDPRSTTVMNKPRFAPNQKAPKDCWTKVRFSPVEGRMFLFPSWLYHSVAPNCAEGEGQSGDRVIISFNLSQAKIRREEGAHAV